MDARKQKDYKREGDPVIETRDMLFVFDILKDVAAKRKRFAGFYRDDDTGELVEVQSDRRIMPRYSDLEP